MEQPKLASIDHLVLTVSDIAASLEFYRSILGMAHAPFVVADGTKRHALRFGTQKINLHEVGAEFEPKARSAAPGTADLCFLSETALGAWQTHLRACGVRIEAGPVARSGAMGPIRSLYIRDPDGNLIEISTAV